MGWFKTTNWFWKLEDLDIPFFPREDSLSHFQTSPRTRYEGSKLNQVKTIMQDESGYWKPTGFGVSFGVSWGLGIQLRVDVYDKAAGT